MKVRLLLLTLLVMCFVMLFAMSASATVVGDIDYTFNGTEASVSSANQTLQIENVIIPATVVYDNTTYTVTSFAEGAFYGNTTIKTLEFEEIANIKSIGKNAFYGCTELTGTYNFSEVKTIGWYAFRNSATAEDSYLVLNLPEIQTIGGSGGDTHVFSDSGLREIYIGNTINAINLNSFTNCTKLWKIQMQDGVKESFTFSSYTFDGCSALKAFSVPEGVKTLPGRMFRNCSNLKAVYLPSTLTTITSGSQEHATFFNCKNMYFVSKSFTFNSDDDVPAKEDIYYFPSGLTSISSGEVFKLCQSLNKTLVFPTGITSISNAWAFEAGISNPTLENIVFLGDMENISTGSWKLTGKIYFANKNDTSSASIATYSNSKSTVFCNADGNTNHLYLENLNREATCTVDGVVGLACFCGTADPSATVVKAKGHEKTSIKTIVYNGTNKFFEKGDITYTCGVCTQEHTVEGDADVIFIALGLSGTERATGTYSVMQSFKIDHDAKKLYNEYSENDIVGYGLVAGTELAVGENAEIFDNNGNVTNAKAGVVNISARAENYDIFEMRISGLESSHDTYDFSALELYCCGYCLVQIGDSVVSYYASEGVVTETLSTTTSYNVLQPVAQE
ncbi:MAG: leucine-rich repeat protein [Clostridia bacterium]|nr:leucine-rich repeat protein [Clostridia bacterium]